MAERGGTGVALPAPRAVPDLVRELGGTADPGALAAVVSRVAEPEAAGEDALAVLTSARRQAAAGAAVVLVAPELAARVPEARRWIHAHPMWVVAQLLAPLERPRPPGIAAQALIEEGADVDGSAAVRPGAIVLAGARIGPRSVIGHGAVIHARVTLGARVVVGENAVIGRPGFGFAAGPDGALVRIPHLGGVIVEEDVEIGALSTVDAGTLSPTVLERGVKLDAQVHVGHNARIGAFTVVAAQSGFAGSVRVGRGVMVGGQVGVADHRTIGDGARLAAGAGVISDVPAGETYAGYPATRRAAWLRTWARLLGGRKERP